MDSLSLSVTSAVEAAGSDIFGGVFEPQEVQECGCVEVNIFK